MAGHGIKIGRARLAAIGHPANQGGRENMMYHSGSTPSVSKLDGDLHTS